MQVNTEPGHLVRREAAPSPWAFWQYQHPDTGEYHLYAWREAAEQQAARALHLGAFKESGSLAVQQVRFLEEPRTCVALELDPEPFRAWLERPTAELAPPFVGHFGSHWSGYGIRLMEAQQVEVIYAADLKHQWLGVFSQADAFATIELDYDRRRRKCLIC